VPCDGNIYQLPAANGRKTDAVVYDADVTTQAESAARQANFGVAASPEYATPIGSWGATTDAQYASLDRAVNPSDRAVNPSESGVEYATPIASWGTTTDAQYASLARAAPSPVNTTESGAYAVLDRVASRSAGGTPALDQEDMEQYC
jgi:hypothetical protein